MSVGSRISDFLLRFKIIAIAGLVSLVFVWLLFFDSHSLLSRIQLHRELSQLEVDNEELQSRIEDLEEQLSRPLTPEEIEKRSREELGMSKEGETVYPLIEE